jgi:glycosyltransferase involved in cell wall biosynthesis
MNQNPAESRPDGNGRSSAGAGGVLAGRTVLRFAHAFESGGGTERYLDDLDRALLERNAMTVVRLHLTRREGALDPVVSPVGQGRLVCVPLMVRPGTDLHSPAPHRPVRYWLKQKARDWLLYCPPIWWLRGAKWCSAVRLPQQAGQAIGAGKATARVLGSQRVDLAVMHFFGGADAEEVLIETRRAGVPAALLNHYANDRYLHLAIRKHTMLAEGIAGVNGLQVPRFVRSRFANLSDGIDTEFFRRCHARPLPQSIPHPVILLPARVVREKGHLDLFRAAAQLHRSGVKCTIAYAGRVDASGFVDELRMEITRAGLEPYVHFLGNLTVEQLRDWYAASAVVAFPTYHPEGLGRVIVEAQAMETPVVAYATGGVPDGIDSGGTGFLVKAGDVAGLTARLQELLGAPARLAAMGKAGRLAAEARFSLAALAARHERFYLQVIASARQPAPA